MFCLIIEKTRMLADFHIPRHSNDIKIAVQKNHLVGQILYRSLAHSKKRRPYKSNDPVYLGHTFYHKW